MRGRLQNIADDGVVVYAPACPDARHPYVIAQCKRSAPARLLRHRVLLPLHPYYPRAHRQGVYAPGPWLSKLFKGSFKSDVEVLLRMLVELESARKELG